MSQHLYVLASVLTHLKTMGFQLEFILLRFVGVFRKRMSQEIQTRNSQSLGAEPGPGACLQAPYGICAVWLLTDSQTPHAGRGHTPNQRLWISSHFTIELDFLLL